ncbi:hypothetical protein ACFL1A_00315 [Patescibacteria group bacterium]
MCIAQIKKVVKVKKNIATMEDGRLVNIGNLKRVKAGDFLEVYANLAISKRSESEVNVIQKERVYKSGGKK